MKAKAKVKAAPKYDAYSLRTVKVIAKRGRSFTTKNSHELHATLRVQDGYAPVKPEDEARGTIHFNFLRYENKHPSTTFAEHPFDLDVNRDELDSLIEALEAFREIGDKAKVWD